MDELSTALGITPMGVRQHLAILEKDGLVTTTSVRRGMGRPSYLYALTDRAQELFPKNYQVFAQGLLADIASHEGEEMVSELFKRRASRLEKAYTDKLRGKNLRDKVAELARILDENGNMAIWRQLGPDTFVIQEHNCGILRVAKDFPQACQAELHLFSRVLDAEVQREHTQAEGKHECRYLIRPRAQAH
ncbi:MAG: ArsR family transcriptional regulator [Firmicutes bacterium]|nr:ArsR family transcriptional regulator [Bacillota bacterium]